MKPAGKFKLWTGGFINRPDITPPGTLKIVFGLCILSVVGTLWFSVTEMLSVGASSSPSSASDVFIGFFHLVLPLTIAMTINSNHPSSRIFIVSYALILYFVTLSDSRLPRFVAASTALDMAIATLALGGVLYWLFGSRKMRYYYAIISGGELPQDLATETDDLSGNAWLSEKLRQRLSWLGDHLELLVYTILAIALIAAMSLTGSGW